MRILKFFFATFAVLLVGLLVSNFFGYKKVKLELPSRSIDTMKYSRDHARATLKGQAFKYPLDQQVADIAKTGASHIAIGTPYDDEFLPVLRIWVKEARRNNLKLYFRGNFSGWEGWFGYKKIDYKTHLEKTRKFIADNPDLFENGDIFSSCPECENGADINLDDSSNLKNYRKFLIEENRISKEAFLKINKTEIPNYFSMNADVAHKVMDRQTTRQLGGIVVIDHYVKSPRILARDIRIIAAKSGGKIVLGEFGTPIPQIHGNMSEEEQKRWLTEAIYRISDIDELIGINYWVNVGGSTALWGDNGEPKPGVEVIEYAYSE